MKKHQQNVYFDSLLFDTVKQASNFNEIRNLFSETIKDYSMFKPDFIRGLSQFKKH